MSQIALLSRRKAASGGPLAAMVLGLFLAAPAAAIQPLTTERLIGYCDAYQGTLDNPIAKACIHYIQGFLAGAVATDDWVARNVARELDRDQAYSERMAEVRFGRETQDYGPTYFAEFCVPDDDPLQDVIEKVVRDLRDPSFVSDTPLARDAVFKALRKDYRCEP